MPCAARIVCDLERLLEADRPTQAVLADLQEDLEQSEGEQAGPHGDSGAGAASELADLR